MRERRWSFPVAASLALLALVASSPALAVTCQTYTGLTYGTYVDGSGVTQGLKLELLVPQGMPAGGNPVPVVLWIHGGGWRTGSRLPIPTRAADLCPRGYAVASVDYRLTTTALWPAQIQDVRGAVRWLRAHAAQYGLDTDRFAAFGDSAGGHLSAFLGMSGGVGTVTVGGVTLDLEGSTGGNLDQSSQVQAVVDWYGATDVLQMHFYPTTVNHDGSGSDESKFLGGPIQDRPELAATANPVTYVDPDDPPLLVLHGTLDKLIPFNQSQLLVDAVRAVGVPARLVPVQGAGHGGSAFDKASNLQIVYDFLDSILKGSAPLTSGDPSTHPSNPPGEVTLATSDRFAVESGPDGGGRITVTRSGSTTSPLTVTYTVSGTATPGADYAALPGSVTIPAGQAWADVDVTPLDDNLFETGETVIVSIGTAGTAGFSSASVVIRDVEPVRPVVAVTLSDLDAAEPSDTGEFIVWRTGSTTDPLTVDLIQDGTAAASDYTLSTSATIAAGSDRVLLKVTPLDDAITEDPETVTLSVAPSPSIYPGPYAGSTVTIADDDLPGTPDLTGLTLSPGSVTGSQSSTATVTLNGPALAGGALVALSSSDPAATVPASVTVPQGSSSATFNVTTTPVTSIRTVSISASRRGLTRTASLTIQPPALSSLTLTPATFAGGCKTSTGKVTLTGKAPVGGIVVTLANTNPVATVPSSITVPSGSTSATFTITAPAVTANQSGTVTASQGGTSLSGGLTVRPIGLTMLTLSPNPVVGPASSSGTVTLECAAAPGSIAIALSSSSTGVANPAAPSLTIPAGSTQGTFTVTTADVSTQSFATIKAVAGGITKSVKLTVDP
jgi:acetyl esterase/lipase